MKFTNDIDLLKNEIRNAVLGNESGHPAGPVEGLTYYNTTDKVPYTYGLSIVTASLGWLPLVTEVLSDLNDVDTSATVAPGDLGAITALVLDTNTSEYKKYTLTSSFYTKTELASTSGTVGASLIGADPSAHTLFTSNNVAGELLELATEITSVDTAKLDLTGGTMSGSVDMGSNLITNVTSPVSDNDAATKIYVDSLLAGLDAKESVDYFTVSNIANFTVQATIEGALDTVSASAPILAVNDRVLVSNQGTASQNGIYYWNGSALVRTTDADITGELSGGSYVFIEQGDTYGGSGWVLNTPGDINPGTTAHTWVQFSGGGSFSEGDGIDIIGSVISASLLTTGGGVTDGYTKMVGGKIATVLGTGSNEAASGDHNHDSDYYTQTEIGSTTTNPGADLVGVDTSGILVDLNPTANNVQNHLESLQTQINTVPVTVTEKYSENLIGGVFSNPKSTFTVTHSLNSEDIMVTIREVATKEIVYADVTIVDANDVSVEFKSGASVTPDNTYRIVVVG